MEPWRFAEPLIRLAAFILMVELTVGCALVSVFTIPSGPRIGGVDLSYSWPLVVVLNPLLIWITARLDKWRWTPLVALVIWMAVVFYLSSSRPEGDIIIPADAPGLVFLLLGTVSGGMAVGRELSPRRGSGSGSDGGR